MQNLVVLFKRHWHSVVLCLLLLVVSGIYSTHLNPSLIPKGYDLLFHLGNVFAMQVKFGFAHHSLASWAVSPLIFHDYGYGTHLFYPPLAHFIPAFISYVMSLVGINSVVVATRLFSFLTILGSGATMFYAAKKISKDNLVYASFASLLYLSAPYLQMDYYWRGGMTSSLCFVFLPILLLSYYYFTKEKFVPYFFAFVASMSLMVWTHLITAFYSFIFIMLALGVTFFFLKNKKAAFLTSFFAGLAILAITSPFWGLYLQQQALQTHLIYSPDYPFNIEAVANNTIRLSQLLDIQFKVWEFKIRNLYGMFTIVNYGLLGVALLLFKPIKRSLKSDRFLFGLIGLLVFILFVMTTKAVWLRLPEYFAYIQYPHRLILHATPIISLLVAMPFLLIQKLSKKIIAGLGVVAVFIVAYTFVFNNYELYEIGTIDYTTHSIIQAMGVEREYLPINAKAQFEYLDTRPYQLLPLTNTTAATPSAAIITNETPYLVAQISNNESKETEFELPRLFYAGYQLKWQAEGAETSTALPYSQSRNGLINTVIPGNGQLTVQYTGGRWYFALVLTAVAVTAYLAFLGYQILIKRKNVWLEKL